MLNVLEVQDALQAAGAQVNVFSTQGRLLCCIYALHLVCMGVGARVKVFSTQGRLHLLHVYNVCMGMGGV